MKQQTTKGAGAETTFAKEAEGLTLCSHSNLCKSRNFVSQRSRGEKSLNIGLRFDSLKGRGEGTFPPTPAVLFKGR